MAICRGCGAESSRFHTFFDQKGDVTREECLSCAPNQFEPEWKRAKGATGPEAYPEKYDKIHMEDGRICYRAKDEWRQDSEDKIRASYERADAADEAAKAEAYARKRAKRRTEPMTPAEISATMDRFLPDIIRRQNDKNERWNAAISQLTQ